MEIILVGYEVRKMPKTFACKEVRVDCPYVARGETEEEPMAYMVKHAKEAHGYTEEQLKDPGMMRKVKPAIKEE